MNWVFSTELNLDALWEYQQLFEQMESQGTFSYGNSKKRRCVRYDRWTYFSMSPACFLQWWTLPKLPFTEAIDVIMPYVVGASHVYETDTDAFWYQWTDLVFDKDLQTLEDREISRDTLALQLFSHHNLLIQVPKILIAYEQLSDYAFFASVRDTSTYGVCRKQNYDAAMGELDRYILAPWEELNMNKLIANLPGYCTWTAGKYLFYQWVCGWSTQLFWNALVNPYVYVKERHAHGEFWSSFYGHKWEDASIYEWSKQLVLENIWNEHIYFRTYPGPDGNTVLLSVYPKKEWLWSYVQKQETWALRAELMNKVTDTFGSLKYEQFWESRYRWINTTKDL